MKRFFAIALLIVTVGVCYAPAVRDGFVWDDTALVLRDPLIRSWRLIPEGFNHYLFVDATPSDFYRPVQRLTYTVEYAFFGTRPGPYHATNIALHAVAAVALMLLIEALLTAFGSPSDRSRWIAFVGALVWAIHPVHTSAVVYVSGRADLLAAAFGFSGCFLLFHGLVRPKRFAWLWTILAGTAFLAGALSKESALVFPVISGVMFLVLKQRRPLIGLGVIIVSVAVIYASLRIPAERNPPPTLGPAAPLSERPITMARAVAEYAGLLILPMRLHMEREVQAPYMHDGYSDSSPFALRELQTLLGITLTAALGLLMVRIFRPNPPVFVLLCAAVLSYVPVSGIVHLNAPVAEHWIYVPSAFLLMAAAVGLAPMLDRIARSKVLLGTGTAVFASWMVFLAGRTFVRTFDWKNQRVFLERTIADGGNSPRMLINLASLESSEGHLDLARKHLVAALQRQPDQPFGIIELAAVCIKQNDFHNAHELLGKARQIELVEATAYELMTILENKETGQANLLRLRLATRTGAPNWAIEKRYVKLLAETGATTAAIQELRVCLQTQWYRSESWQLLARLLAKNGDAQGAAYAMNLAMNYDVHLNRDSAVL